MHIRRWSYQQGNLQEKWVRKGDRGVSQRLRLRSRWNRYQASSSSNRPYGARPEGLDHWGIPQNWGASCCPPKDGNHSGEVHYVEAIVGGHFRKGKGKAFWQRLGLHHAMQRWPSTSWATCKKRRPRIQPLDFRSEENLPRLHHRVGGKWRPSDSVGRNRPHSQAERH